MTRRIEKKMEEKVMEVERERDEEMKRAEKAEREREEMRRRAEIAEKEKDEKVKQAEMERDRCVKEAEEYKKRAEIAEEGKESCWRRVESLESILRGNCLNHQKANQDNQYSLIDFSVDHRQHDDGLVCE